MSLPSSIWVKFTNEDAVLVTYLGVQYRMTVNEAEGWYEIVLTGSTATTGTVLVVNTGAPDMSGTATNDIALYDVENTTYTLSSTIGTLTYDNWSVTSFTGTDISAASIVHRDSRLPLFVELPYSNEAVSPRELFTIAVLDGGFDAPYAGYTLTVETHSGGGVDPGFYPVLDGNEPSYSLTWDSSTNTGTTDCPFVSFIGELPVTEVFTTSGTWTPSANIDTTKPVIVQAWGSGADGVDDGGWGGGGGSYAGADISALTISTSTVVVDPSFGGSTTSVQCVSPSIQYVQAESGGFTDQEGGGNAGSNTGDVKFSGGDGGQGSNPNTSGGSAANSFSNGVDGTNGSTLSGGDGGTGGAAVDSSPGQAGTTPGGGGGAGGDGMAGGAGARGEVRIHYRLAEEPPPEPEEPAIVTIPQEGSRKTINISGQAQIINGKIVVDGVELSISNAIIQTGGKVKRLGDGGGISTAGPKFGSQEFLEVPKNNLS